MKLFLITTVLLLSSIAKADYLECKNNEERSTEIGFFNHDGDIVFQLSAPYYDEYLYVLGHCYSEAEIGLPYSCEAESGDERKAVSLALISGEQGKPTAELTMRMQDGTSQAEAISCVHFQ